MKQTIEITEKFYGSYEEIIDFFERIQVEYPDYKTISVESKESVVDFKETLLIRVIITKGEYSK